MKPVITWNGIVLQAFDDVRIDADADADEPVSVSVSARATGTVLLTKLSGPELKPRGICSSCGEDMLDLGELAENLGDERPELVGKSVCRAVVAYAFELGRRGDNRAVTHELMREDGERWLSELRQGRERDTTLQ